MAYVSASVAEQFTTAATSFAFTAMPTHASGDLLLFYVTQDGGTGTLAATGYTEVGTQIARQAQRTAVFYKVAASSSETLTVTSSLSDEATITVMTIKGSDTSDPINGEGRNDSGANAGTCASASLTTDEDNVLLLYGWGYDGTQRLTVPPADLVNISKEDNTCQQIVGYRNQLTAGAAPSVTAVCEVATEGGTSIVVGINDDGTGKRAPMIGSTYTILRRYGLWGEVLDGTNTSFTANNIDGSSLTDIGGIALDATAPTNTNTDDATYTWGSGSRLAWTDAPGAGQEFIHGSYTGITATNFTGKIFSVQWLAPSVTSTLIGSTGFFVFFEDSTGDAAVFQMAPRDGTAAGISYTYFVACDAQTPFDTVGTIDWTDITRIGYAYHRRETSTSAVGIQVKDACLHPNTVLVGGSASYPVDPVFLRTALEGWGQGPLLGYQGAGQVLNRVGFSIGDGTIPTYYKGTTTSYELPRSYITTSTVQRRQWNVPNERAEFRIKATATDTVNMTTSLIVTDTKQDFVIDSASSTSATYNFSGLGLSGWEVTGKSGVTFNGAVFDACYKLTLGGGGLNGCTVTNSRDTIAVTTTDPETITDTSFVSAGTGHAIEATTTGTFDFEGNTFSGYGADGSTDASFYNNSGGAITLTIPAGDATPTVRNGAGASTTIDTPSANQSVTISGATAGSRIEIYDLTSSTQLYEGTPTFPYTWTDGSAYVADRQIRLRVAYVNGTSAKEFMEVIIGTSTSTVPALSYLVAQVNDATYNANAVDGSAVTDITINDGTMLLSIDDPTVTWQDIYAYEMYWLFTSAGIEDLGQSITSPDPANYLMDSAVLTIKNISGSASVLTGGWGRDATSGSTLDIIDLTGDPIFTNPPHVVSYAVGSGVVPQDIVDIADAVWDEALSGHTTAGSAGKAAKDASKAKLLL